MSQQTELEKLEAQAAEVQLGVLGQGRVARRQHEPVATQPVNITGVVAHRALEQRVRQRRQAHRCSGMAIADFLNGVGGQHPHRVDRSRIDLGPVVGVARAGDFSGNMPTEVPSGGILAGLSTSTAAGDQVNVA